MRRSVKVGAALAALTAVPLLTADSVGLAANSTCYGTYGEGRVAGAIRMPFSGPNFAPYCAPCVAALRTYGHAPAIESTVAAYRELEGTRPQTRFLYGEIGFPWGGRFRPHRSHRNGLSFDFMVPLTEGILPTGPSNRYGYDAEFDTQGVGEAGRIDFEAIALHLAALDRAARERGGSVARVFFAPDLQDELRAVAGNALDGIRLNQRQSWVRHDDHYHVDFAFPCGALG